MEKGRNGLGIDPYEAFDVVLICQIGCHLAALKPRVQITPRQVFVQDPRSSHPDNGLREKILAAPSPAASCTQRVKERPCPQSSSVSQSWRRRRLLIISSPKRSGSTAFSCPI